LAFERLKRTAARSAPVTLLLFGVRVPRRADQGRWDFSTLILFRELKNRLKPGQRILELGTGESGTLSVAMARLVPAQYLAIDISAEAIASAKQVAADNRVTVEFRQSDLFSAVPDTRRFDLTFFNPPYVPRAQAEKWKPYGEPSRVYDGGEDGLDVIRRFFLEAEPRASTLGTILIGFNRRLVTEEAIIEIARSRAFRRTGVSRALHGGTVLVFEAGREPGAREGDQSPRRAR
jgi:methylase of polypeptide subunit release factors